MKQSWNFIKPVESTSTPNVSTFIVFCCYYGAIINVLLNLQTFYWTAVSENYDSFSGPFKRYNALLNGNAFIFEIDVLVYVQCAGMLDRCSVDSKHCV